MIAESNIMHISFNIDSTQLVYRKGLCDTHQQPFEERGKI